MTLPQSASIPDEQAQKRVLRGAAFWAIWLPFIGAFVLLLVLVVSTAAFPDMRQTDLVANFLLIFVLCPAILCFFPVYLLLVAAVYGMGRLNQGVAKPMMALERLTASVDARTSTISERVAKASITLNARLASIDRAVFSKFDDHPEKRGTSDEQSSDQE